MGFANYTYHDLGLANIDVLASAERIFQPQPGGQTMFMKSEATVRFYGGAAGSGKTYAELMDPLRFISNPYYNAIILRAMEDDITTLGGVWDESKGIYPYANGKPKEDALRWVFPQGAKIEMAGIGREEDLERWKSAQFCGLYIEEGTEISEKQFRYMLGRNRSTSGIKPYAAVTCNPVPDTWVYEFVKWYLTPEGYPDPDKRGVIRYFATVGERFVYGESPEAICSQYDGLNLKDCTSYTFIYATLEDNPKLLETNPNYVTSLKNTGEVQAKRLLGGNWNAIAPGKIFKEEDFRYYHLIPSSLQYIVIFIDTATKTATRNDYSVAQCWGRAGKNIYKLKQFRGKFTITPLLNCITTFAAMCKREYDVPFMGLKIEDSAAGPQIAQLMQEDPNHNFPVELIARKKDKYTRAMECQLYLEGHYVFVDNSADDYHTFITEVVAFTGLDEHKPGYHDDQVDCLMDAIDFMLINGENALASISNHTTEFEHQLIE